MTMRILVAYASARGSTRGVARLIGERLEAEGFDADVQSVEHVRSTDGYDAFVLGSAIHHNRWLPAAVSFVLRHEGVLSRHPTWLFSVSSLGETSSVFGPRVSRQMRTMRRDAPELDALRGSTHARAHRHFAGVIAREHWNLAGHLFLKALGGHYGDHRDFGDIDAWALGIADVLRLEGRSAARRAS
jgi:menaquinone-dependent protoporphyrinogen oxidase